MLLETLAINRKITAFLADGTRQMNLGISSVTALLNGTARVPVVVAPVKFSSDRLEGDDENGRPEKASIFNFWMTYVHRNAYVDRQLLLTLISISNVRLALFSPV